MNSDKKIRTRFAPSPTGPLHVGGVRTALFCYLFAKSHGGDFILRIEDTDKKREVVGAEKYIMDSLEWLGMQPDESPVHGGNFGPYRQSERLDIYKKYALQLIELGHAYYSFDTEDELKSAKLKWETSGIKNPSYNYFTRQSMKNSTVLSSEDVKVRIGSGIPYVIRFKMPKNENVIFDDTIRGNVSFNTDNLDDKVLFKSDGFPTYHLANVVDDYLMEITHVIRGEEWLPSTPLHVLLYKAFGWTKPEFAHLPSVLGPDGKKLSKRHAEKYGFPIFPINWTYVNDEGRGVSILGFKDAGYRADALLNFISLLGWSPGNDLEIMTVHEMSKLFGLSRISKGGAMFDFDKLKNFNAHYLRNSSFDELSKFIPNDGKYTTDKMVKILEVAKERSIFEKELYDMVSYFFEDVKISENLKMKNSEHFKNFVDGVFSIKHLDDAFKSENGVKSAVEGVCLSLGIKTGVIMPDLRMALTGGKPGPELPLTMWILGLEESERRIRKLITEKKEIAL